MDGVTGRTTSAVLDFSHFGETLPEPAPAPPREISLHLRVRDPEVVAELARHDDEDARDHYALTALRLGILALRQASGVLDAQSIQQEANRLIEQVDRLVTGNATTLAAKLSDSLREYFDPSSGKIVDRLNRLVQKDGELSRLLCEHLDGESSRLVRTLASHVGASSPLMQMLSPQQKDGLVSRVQSAIGESLKQQADQILRQFSLDDRESALSRCVNQLTDSNGRLRKELAADVDAVKREFSLDNPDGALHRLVSRVEQAHDAIAEEFSLNNEQSAINHLSGLMEKTRESMQQQIAELFKASGDFHNEVRQTLAVLAVRKQEAARGTRHGLEFEQLVLETIAPQLQSAGDLIESVGNTTGCKPYCKKGDFTITLGPESSAPGTKIVIECKQEAGFNEAAALEELKEARPNRGAQVGIFVFSKQTAPPTLPPLRRIGNDICCIWDKDDANSDVILTAALSIARALVVRQKVEDAKKTAELAEIEGCINRIESTARKLDDVEKWAGTIITSGQKIGDTARSMRDTLQKQVEGLRDSVAAVKQDG